MKKLIKGLTLGLVMLGSFAFGQTAEDARVSFAKEIVVMRANTKDAYTTSKSYDEFKVRLLNSTQVNTQEGEKLLSVLYNYHKSNTDDKKIIESYGGVEVANAFARLQIINKETGSQNDGQILFSTGTITAKAADGGYPCKWYQVRCHLVELFGEKAADAIIDIGIMVLSALLL